MTACLSFLIFYQIQIQDFSGLHSYRRPGFQASQVPVAASRSLHPCTSLQSEILMLAPYFPERWQMSKEEKEDEISEQELDAFGGIQRGVILPPKPSIDFVDFAIE